MSDTQKKIPIGIEDYKKLVTEDYYYVDKSLFIKDVIERGNLVQLFTRLFRFHSRRSPDHAGNLWNILFFAGYLKPYKESILKEGRFEFPLVLVNQEIQLIIKDNLEYWYQSLPSTGRTATLVKALENGDAECVEMELNDFLMRTVSFRDRAENFYHGYIAGLLSNPAEYECLSNREAGNGISDILLERLDRKAGTVIEVKIAKSPRNLAKMAETALKQTIKKGYDNELTKRRFANVHVYGIACFGKKCCVRMLSTMDNGQWTMNYMSLMSFQSLYARETKQIEKKTSTHNERIDNSSRRRKCHSSDYGSSEEDSFWRGDSRQV